MIHENRGKDAPGGSRHAYFPGGAYTYEKTFTVDAAQAGKPMLLHFEGAYRNSAVTVNGREAGKCAYGYIPFTVDVTDLVHEGENTISVRVDNSQLPNSRWYSGSGIYRPVWLLTGEPDHIAFEGVKVDTICLSPAKIRVRTEIVGGGDVAIEIWDANGKPVAEGQGADVTLDIRNAQLWSAEAPYLYTAHVMLKKDGKPVDEDTVSFGIRQITWSNQGLFVNGQETLLRGGCIHHDMNMYHNIQPGKVWLDTEGKPIQAHGFSVFFNENEKLWYWYGENKEKTVGGKKNTVWHWGVRLYTSPDLYNWTDKGLIIPPTPDDLSSPLHPTYCMDRPHIIYNEKTKKYVAWLKIMAGEVSQFMSVMTADRSEGPYHFVRKIYKPLDMDTGDFCLHVDEKTGKAYIWFERPHFQLICATLTDDYTAVTDECSVHYDNWIVPETREAPTFFERNGKKYLITSGTSGYFPNPSRVCVFDEYHGEYKDLGLICEGDKSGTSFNAQFTSVIQANGQYIACADRWMPQWWVPMMARQIVSGTARHFKDYKPDTSPRKAEPLPEKELTHTENTSISRYVWLPIEWEGEKPVIRWRREWKIG